MKLSLLLGLFLECLWILPSHSIAQTPELARAKATYDALRKASNEMDRMALHGQLQSLWSEALEAGGVLDVSWEDWEQAVVDLGEGPDRLVVLTWNVEKDNRTHVYGGWILMANPNNQERGYDYVMLSHDPAHNPEDAARMYRHDSWQGGLYYDGILTFDGNQPVYTLLAWDGADALVTRKWAETIDVRRGRVRLGTPAFELPEGLRKRMVLTYRDAVQATLTWEPENMRIVMDHLAPEEPSMTGQYAFYGPTLSYDALVWKRGAWVFEADVQVINPSSGSPKEYRDPSKARRSRRN
ncbi:MAG: hypothetical protein O3C18_02785 [Bacteroidetes bacterium]|nr:hypothetical protein [Bacteroidota bacterium]